MDREELVLSLPLHKKKLKNLEPISRCQWSRSHSGTGAFPA